MGLLNWLRFMAGTPKGQASIIEAVAAEQMKINNHMVNRADKVSVAHYILSSTNYNNGPELQLG